MNLVAIMPAKNEGWIIGLSARAALMYCDSIVILDHESTDETPQTIMDLIEGFPGRVHMLQVSGPWKEMEHRQMLLEFARALGATHISNVDADEVLCGDLLPVIRGHIEKLSPAQFLGIPMKNLHRSLNEYRADNSPFGAMAGTMLAFADSPRLSWSSQNGYDHHSRAPHGISRPPTMLKTDGGLMHLQFTYWRRLLAKHAAYKVMERLKYPNKRIAEIENTYNLAPNETGLKLRPVNPAWWAPYAHLMKYLDVDREPWQEAETRELVAEHGSGHFVGLNLFGVA